MKAFVEGGLSLIVPFQYEISSEEARALDVAQEFIYRNEWKVEITGCGALANGDYVVTIK